MSHNLRAALKEFNLGNKLCLVPRSYQIIGSRMKAVAIIELTEDLKEFEQEIAEALMGLNKNIKSVLVKASERKDEYRIRNYKLIGGDPNTEVIHKESGCFFRLDPRLVYFSTRESIERDRIVRIVRDKEDIMVLFSGIAPLPIRIAKKHMFVKITGVELNPNAHKYAIENIHFNKVSDRIKLIYGDVKEVCPKIDKQFDRLLMPLPKGAYKYLDIAISLIRSGGIIHFYHWAHENQLFEESEKLLLIALNKAKKRGEILKRVKVSQYSPRIWKIRLDVKIKKIARTKI